MNKTDYPQVFGSNLALYTETNYMAICGKVPEFVNVDRKLTALANQAYKDKMMMARKYRHRAIVWGVQSHFIWTFALDLKLLGHRSADRYAFHGQYRNDRRGRYTGEPRKGIL